MYGIIVRNYPDSRYRKFAALREIYANISAYKGPSYDRSPLVEARILIDDFQSRYPADAEQAGVSTQLETWVNESDAEHLFNTAMWYLNRSDEASARFTMRRLIRDNPQSAAATEAVVLMIDRGWLAPPTPTSSEDRSDESPE
jgi:outer membrane protein assembly factor BamD (BamD/ComL family)